MPRRSFVLVAALAVVVSLGSFEIARATGPAPHAVSATQSLNACSTSSGYLRLADGSASCGSYSKVALAQAASAPKAVAINTSNFATDTTKSLSLIAGTKLTAQCHLNTNNNYLQARLTVDHAGSLQIDGTTMLAKTGTSGGYYATHSSSGELASGAQPFFSAETGDFVAAASHSGGAFATINAHLVLTVAGAVFMVALVLDSNTFGQYCRVSMVVTQVAV